VNATIGSDIAVQTSYQLEPQLKAIVSKLIDGLLKNEEVLTIINDTTVLTRDALVEVDGTLRMTAASLAGKLFYTIKEALKNSGGSLDEIFDLSIDDPSVVESIRRVYLQNELPPIPILLEVANTGLTQKVYVSVKPNHFIERASAARIEGNYRVFGTISRLVPPGGDGYESTEQWLLFDWEYLLCRKLMTTMDDTLDNLIDSLEIDLPAKDVLTYISGPAIVIEAIAIY